MRTADAADFYSNLADFLVLSDHVSRPQAEAEELRRQQEQDRHDKALVAEVIKRQAPVMEAIGNEVEAMKAKSKPRGLPGRHVDVAGTGLIAKTHKLKEHAKWETDEVSRRIYPKLPLPEGRRRVSDNENKGRKRCPECASANSKGTFTILDVDATDEEIEAFCRALGWLPEE